MNERTNERTGAPPVPSETLDALKAMASHVAERLVGEALHGMLGHNGVTVTVHAHSAATVERRALPPADLPRRRRGRKPGPKPTISKGAGRSQRPATRQAAGASPARPSSDAVVRTCRNCFKRGPVVQGSGRSVKCGSCGFSWAMREKRSEAGAVGASAKHPRPQAPAAGRACVRCDHDRSAHIGEGGKCLTPRCACVSFYD